MDNASMRRSLILYPRIEVGTQFPNCLRPIWNWNASHLCVHAYMRVCVCVYVTEQYGKLWSLSNRRLFVARVLEHIRLVNQVGIMLYPFGHPRVKRVRDGRIKFERSYSNKNGGIQVLVKSLWTWAQSPKEWWCYFETGTFFFHPYMSQCGNIVAGNFPGLPARKVFHWPSTQDDKIPLCIKRILLTKPT